MLKIINDLKPFFEDCYERVNVRMYAKIVGVSPPTASKLLSYYESQGLLLREAYKNYIMFYANRESRDFVDLSRVYWRRRLEQLLKLSENVLVNPTIVLFGSLSKAEAKKDSDIDIAIFAHRKDLDLEAVGKKLSRKIQSFWFTSLDDIKNRELANNIINGYVLSGRLSL